jgi:hypothetical protein
MDTVEKREHRSGSSSKCAETRDRGSNGEARGDGWASEGRKEDDN